ncbi:FAD-dependent oxidoreductase [Thermodesulfobacteriota bacterium]
MISALTALMAIGGIGLVAGLGLALASKIFYVYVDPKIIAVEEALPGANCGGCGFPGCSGAASAIVRGVTPPNVCVAGGSNVHARIAAILGVEVKEIEPEIALPGCTYGLEKADLKYIYDGFNDCRAAVLLNGGSKECPIGCLGLGTCEKACPFGAITMGPDNLPVVNEALCTGCGTCERVCPRHIITLTSNSLCIQREFTTDQCTAPCQRSCPAGIDIPLYIRNIAEGNYQEAVRVIRQTNPFPLVCGRICVHPCELECRRNLVDDPVAINNLKRFATDYDMNSGNPVQVSRAPETDKRVAVVGGGVEGLTAAFLLNRMGHDADVYEATSRLGGILRSAIPQNRLPTYVLDWEINYILDAGVNVKTGQKLGRDFTVSSLLKEDYSGVFIATGGWDTQLSIREKGKPSRVLPGVYLLIDYINGSRAGNTPSTGKRIMILGGGNSAFEAASESIKNGARDVYVVFRNSREAVPFSEAKLRDIEEQGAQLIFQAGLTKMMGKGDSLTHIEIAYIAPDGSEMEDREIIEVETILTGAGRFPELIYVKAPEEKKAEQEDDDDGEITWETLSPYPGPYAEQDIGIFRPGEAANDYRAVVHAIGAGRRASNSMNLFLAGKAVESPPNMIKTFTPVLNLKQVDPIPRSKRVIMPERPVAERITDPSLEITMGYSEKDAVEEAKRCLQCGLICYRRVEGTSH